MADVDNVNLQDEDKNTLLHKSVNNNQLEEVENLMRNGADASLVNSNGNTPLHDAVVKNYHDIVEVILVYSGREKLEKFIDATTLENKSTALHIATSNGCYESVSCLLSYGANFEVKDDNGSRPIDLAKDYTVKKLFVNIELDSRLAAVGKYNVLETRLKGYSSADLMASCYARNNERMTSLQMAVKNNHCNTVNVIVKVRTGIRPRDYDVETDEMSRKLGEFVEPAKISSNHSSTFMFYSQHSGTVDVDTMARDVTVILSAAYDIVRVDENVFKTNDEPYEQPGLIAVIEETLEVLQFKPEYANFSDENILLQRNDARYYQMLFNRGESKNYNDVISYMCILQITITQNIAEFTGRIFTIKLIESAKNNDIKMFEKCIDEKFVDINLYLSEDDVRTPLHYASENGNEEMVSRLLDKKAAVYWYTESNCETALYAATKNGHFGIVKMLLESTNDEIVNMETFKEGWTPMHVAAKIGRLDIIKCLLENWGKYDQKDRNGRKPIDLSDNEQVITFFKYLDELFEMAKSGNPNLVEKLKAVQADEFLAVCNTHNSSEETLAEIFVMNGYNDNAEHIFDIVHKANPIKPRKVLNLDDHFSNVDTYILLEFLKLSNT